MKIVKQASHFANILQGKEVYHKLLEIIANRSKD